MQCMNFNEGEKPTSPEETRGKIKGALENAKKKWNDSREVNIQKPLDLPSLGMRISDQSAIELDEESDQGAIMSSFIDALCYLKSTKGFTNFMLGYLAKLHGFGTSAEFALASFGVNLEENQLGVFEPELIYQTETKLLEEKLRAASIGIIKTLGAPLKTKDEEKLTAKDASLVMILQMRDPKTNTLWEYRDLQEYLDGKLKGAHRLIQIGLENIRFSVEWADEFSQFFEDTRFTKVSDTLRPVLGYLELAST